MGGLNQRQQSQHIKEKYKVLNCQSF